MAGTLRDDLRAALERDPAARSKIEVALLYPGVHAVWGHRVSHWLWRRDLKLLARSCAALTQWCTAVDIHPGAVLGPGLFIDHGTGVVIGQTAEIGEGVTVYQGVTLGGTSMERGKRHPTIGDRVTIGAGAKILGPIEIGAGSRIGANAVVVKSVPPDSVVVGVPGQVIARSRPRPASPRADLDDTLLPDLVGTSLRSLWDRVDRLEASVDGATTRRHARPSDTGVWSGEDFSI